MLCFVVLMALMATTYLLVWEDRASGFQVGDYYKHRVLSINDFK